VAFVIATNTGDLVAQLLSVIHTCMPLLPRSIIWYWFKEGDALRLRSNQGLVTFSLAVPCSRTTLVDALDRGDSRCLTSQQCLTRLTTPLCCAASRNVRHYRHYTGLVLVIPSSEEDFSLLQRNQFNSIVCCAE